MSDYTKTTNFAAKDSLPSGNSGKIVKGSEIDTEFTNIQTAVATKLDINNSALTGTTTAQTLSISTLLDVNSNATFGDSNKAIFGAGSDLQIYHDGTDSYITEVGNGNLIVRADGGTLFQGATAGESLLTLLENGAVTAYYDNAAKLATTSTGIDVTGVITTDGMTTSADINFGDNDKAIFGAGSDLSIYSDGTQSFIQEDGPGALYIQGTHLNFNNAAGNASYITAVDGGAVTLFSAGSAKLATTATGIDVTGSVVSDGLEVEAATPILEINSTTTSNTATIQFTSSGTVDSKITHVGNTGIMTIDSGRNSSWGGKIAFVTDTEERMRISGGNLLVSKTDVSTSTVGVELRETGKGMFTASGTDPLFVNRLSSDGDIAKFFKDNGHVGSIGTLSGDLNIGSGDTGLDFSAGLDAIMPYNPSTNGLRDNTIDLGQSSVRFDDIYATNGTIQTSDRNEKQDIEALSDAKQRVAVAAKGLLRKFRWKSSVAENGDEARIHFGIIAQDLQAAFEAEGLDAGRYAMFINSTWTDEETGEERTRMGVRYSELLAFIIAAI